MAATTAAEARYCAACGKTQAKLSVAGETLKACSRRSDWPDHKDACKLLSTSSDATTTEQMMEHVLMDRSFGGYCSAFQLAGYTKYGPGAVVVHMLRGAHDAVTRNAEVASHAAAAAKSESVEVFDVNQPSQVSADAMLKPRASYSGGASASNGIPPEQHRYVRLTFLHAAAFNEVTLLPAWQLLNSTLDICKKIARDYRPGRAFPLLLVDSTGAAHMMAMFNWLDNDWLPTLTMSQMQLLDWEREDGEDILDVGTYVKVMRHLKARRRVIKASDEPDRVACLPQSDNDQAMLPPLAMPMTVKQTPKQAHDKLAKQQMEKLTANS